MCCGTRTGRTIKDGVAALQNQMYTEILDARAFSQWKFPGLLPEESVRYKYYRGIAGATSDCNSRK
jgi:hypothetical protein